MSNDQITNLAAAVVTVIVALSTATVTIIHEVKRTHRLVNSRMDELLAMTRAAALAEGALAEKESETRPGTS